MSKKKDKTEEYADGYMTGYIENLTKVLGWIESGLGLTEIKNKVSFELKSLKSE